MNAPAPNCITNLEEILAALRQPSVPHYAVLDAARDPSMLKLLRRSRCEFQSLYEGPQGEELATVAPYLLRFSGDVGFLEHLVRNGWGKSWGIYLSCEGASFKELRRHLRRFLMVQEEGTGARLYFRFYDPRVLRVFLPICTLDQTTEFFGPIQHFFVEGEHRELLVIGRMGVIGGQKKYR